MEPDYSEQCQSIYCVIQFTPCCWCLLCFVVLQGVLEALQKQLPSLPGLRQILDATFGPVINNLDLAVDQASKAGLQALDLASKGVLDGLAGGIDKVAKLLDDAQWQVGTMCCLALLPSALAAHSQQTE